MRTALITGVTGQDGRHLAPVLAEKGMRVIGVSRTSRPVEGAEVRALDVTDAAALAELVRELAPAEAYHLAAHHRSSSAVAGEDDDPAYWATLVGGHALLHAVRRHAPGCRVFLAASAHVFGNTPISPQDEGTPFDPTNVYGIAKVALLQLGRYYRRAGTWVSGGILYQHESALRAPEFLSQRIATTAAAIAAGDTARLVIGDLGAQVDWGYAGDHVRAMHLILQAGEPDEFVIATGAARRVRDFVEIAFAHVGLDWTRHVTEDASVHRRVGTATYVGNPARLRDRTGWSPRVSFEELVHSMVDAAVERRKRKEA